jgi:hypothetical protein
MLSGIHREQGLTVSCVVARAGEAGPGRLAIADIVADHRAVPAVTSARAASMLASLPGCSVFLASHCGGYLAFTRGGMCFPVRRAVGRGGVPAVTAEACAVALYACACASRLPPAAIMVISVPVPDISGPVTRWSATVAAAPRPPG